MKTSRFSRGSLAEATRALVATRNVPCGARPTRPATRRACTHTSQAGAERSSARGDPDCAASTSGRSGSGERAARPCGHAHASGAPRAPTRRTLLRASLAPALALAAMGSDDATTILNSVLSGYGLPTLKASAGFKAYDEFGDEWSFEYPRAWVARPNSMRKGVVISDYQTADKLAVEELDLPEGGDVITAAVAAAVLPGGRLLKQDDRLSLPPRRSVKSSSAVVDGQEYVYLEFPSETVTRSGYQITRRNLVAAAARRGRLFVLAASARGDQYDAGKRATLERIVQSFRLR